MKKWNPMNVFSYCMIGVGFAAISVAIGMYINLGMTEILKNFVVWMIGGADLWLDLRLRRAFGCSAHRPHASDHCNHLRGHPCDFIPAALCIRAQHQSKTQQINFS